MGSSRLRAVYGQLLSAQDIAFSRQTSLARATTSYLRRLNGIVGKRWQATSASRWPLTSKYTFVPRRTLGNAGRSGPCNQHIILHKRKILRRSRRAGTDCRPSRWWPECETGVGSNGLYDCVPGQSHRVCTRVASRAASVLAAGCNAQHKNSFAAPRFAHVMAQINTSSKLIVRISCQVFLAPGFCSGSGNKATLSLSLSLMPIRK